VGIPSVHDIHFEYIVLESARTVEYDVRERSPFMPDPQARSPIWMRPEPPQRSGPGRRPGYTRAQITAAAVAIADEEGLEAVTMRRVAAEFGTGAMTLYRYLTGRHDVIDLMIDAVLGEIDLPSRPSGNWRSDLTLVANRTRQVGLRHPWWTALADRPAALGPNMLRVQEFALSALDGHGLDIDETLSLIELFSDHVHNAVHREIGWQRQAHRTGMDMTAWMNDYLGPYVAHIVADGRFPMFNRTVEDARVPHLPPEQRFRHGLSLLLDSIAAIVSTRTKPPTHDSAVRAPDPQ
jgi:AcrR family transcriptional regulator